MTARPNDPEIPPPLTVAASLAAVEALILLGLAVAEFADVSPSRLGFGISTGVFFAAYGVLLLAAAWALWRVRSWARGPILITQLIVLGLAWNLREHALLALVLAALGLVAIAAVLHPATIAALEGRSADDPQS